MNSQSSWFVSVERYNIKFGAFFLQGVVIHRSEGVSESDPLLRGIHNKINEFECLRALLDPLYLLTIKGTVGLDSQGSSSHL